MNKKEEKDVNACFRMLHEVTMKSALQSPAAYSKKIDCKARDTNALAEQLQLVLDGSKNKQQTAFYRELNTVLNLRERSVALIKLAGILLANNISLGRDLTKFPYNWLYTGATTAFRHYGQYQIYFIGSAKVSLAMEMPDDSNNFIHIDPDGSVDLYSDLKHGHIKFIEPDGKLTPENEERNKLMYEAFSEPMTLSGVHIWDIPVMHTMLKMFADAFPKFEAAFVEYGNRILEKKLKELKNEK